MYIFILESGGGAIASVVKRKKSFFPQLKIYGKFMGGGGSFLHLAAYFYNLFVDLKRETILLLKSYMLRWNLRTFTQNSIDT